MRRLLLELYVTSTVFVLAAGILIGRIWARLDAPPETASIALASVGAQDAVPYAAPEGIDLAAGKKLFRNKCASCHADNMRDDLTGPALGGVRERWADYPAGDLAAWIRNSGKLIKSGHPRANEVYRAWDKSRMPAFRGLSDADVADLLGYVDAQSVGATVR